MGFCLSPPTPLPLNLSFIHQKYQQNIHSQTSYLFSSAAINRQYVILAALNILLVILNVIISPYFARLKKYLHTPVLRYRDNLAFSLLSAYLRYSTLCQKLPISALKQAIDKTLLTLKALLCIGHRQKLIQTCKKPQNFKPKHCAITGKCKYMIFMDFQNKRSLLFIMF